MNQLSAMPNSQDLVGWKVEPIPLSQGEWRVVFYYPDCDRTFERKQWSVVAAPVEALNENQ